MRNIQLRGDCINPGKTGWWPGLDSNGGSENNWKDWAMFYRKIQQVLLMVWLRKIRETKELRWLRKSVSLINSHSSYGLPAFNQKGHILFFNLVYWSIVDLQRCVNFCCTAKWFNYTYINIYILFSYSFPL